MCGGETPSITNTTLEYDGTDYSSGGNLNTARGSLSPSAAGTLTAGLVFGGQEPSSSDATEEYDGSSWTNGGDMISAIQQNASATNAVQTDALSFAGDPSVAATIGYDGTSWSTRPAMATGRHKVGGFGTGPAAAVMGGTTGPTSGVTTTEEFTGETTTDTASTIDFD